MESNYDKFPFTEIEGFAQDAREGWVDILNSLESQESSSIWVIECYHGVDQDELIQALNQLEGASLINAADAYRDEESIAKMVYPDVTDDPVFGKLTELSILDFFDPDKVVTLREQIKASDQDRTIIFGVGAAYVAEEWDLLVYADMARWEIQQRMRKNLVSNLGVENKEQAFSMQYKQAFFVDWRVCDRLKFGLLNSIDFYLDTHKPANPKMISGAAWRSGLEQVARQPFRLVPFFDPGPWGGQWMKEVCDLDKSVENFAWCFDCVPEENSLLLKYGDTIIEMPSLDLLLYRGEEVMGEEIYSVLGPEFPIRFDFLDTMDGGNLSLQVHPLTEYIREKFGITYTQDESYYMLDAKDNALVYLGLREGIDPDQMIASLKEAQNGGAHFPAEEFVETWKVKKHDHILIPAGTVHCSGKDSMVLEISATPYIFTFKLWDWGRMGLDGKPRPINIDHGKAVIQWDRTTEWTRNNLVNQFQLLESGEDYREEKTGLHDLEFIETRRHWFRGKVTHHTEGRVNVLNLVEGREAIVESPDNSFQPFKVHYAETFVVPASVGTYTIRPSGESVGEEFGTIKAYVRDGSLRALGSDLVMLKKDILNGKD